jgi:HEAT repeat protein
MGDRVREQIAALRDEDWAVREEAATALGHLRDVQAVGPLIRILRDADRCVRDAAVGALTAIGEAAVEPVAACLTDPDLNLQEAAACILERIADHRVIGVLVKALGSSDWIVRAHAARALGRIGDVACVQPLIPLLQDTVKAVREDAAAGLARIGAAAVPTLLQALTHPDWVMRLHAVEALGKIKSPDAVAPLLGLLFNDRDAAVREDAARSLGEIGDARAVEFLLVAMKEPGVRPVAIEALGKIRDGRAVPALLAVVDGSARPEHTRPVHGCGDRYDDEMLAMEAAVKALALIGDPSVIPALTEALKNTVVRAEAASALASFGQAALPSMLDLLKREQDENIRYHVQEALGRVGWRPNRI